MINDLSKVAKVQEQERKRLEVHSGLEIFKKKPKIHLSFLSFEGEKKEISILTSCTKFQVKNISKKKIVGCIRNLRLFIAALISYINATF